MTTEESAQEETAQEEIESEATPLLTKIAWTFTTLLVLISLGLVFSGGFLAAACVFFAGLVVMPGFQEEFNKNSESKIGAAHRFGAVSLLLLVGAIAAPTSDDSSNSEAGGRGGATPRTYHAMQHKPLKDIDELSPERARNLAAGFALDNSVDAEYHDAFYRCLGDNVRSKSADLELRTVMSWCLMDYERDPARFKQKQSAYSYFDLKTQFSAWDGSHRSSVEAIKRAMHDGSSYKHVETRYRLDRTGDSSARLIVMTRFRGTNVFGGVVTSLARTTVDVDTGRVLNIEFD